jgi:hypothetical protein
MPLILGANSLTGGYEIDNSCRFNVPSGDYLIRSISSSGSNQKFTASGWIKRTQFVASSAIYCSSDASSNHNFRSLFITADDKVQCAFINGTYTFQVETSALLRDPSAWYHIVTSVDTTQVISSDRVKIWINGVLQTSFSTASYPTLNSTNNFSGTDIKQLIASLRDGSTILNGGYLSEIYVLDGINKTAEDFGEFDEDSGIWKPIAYEGTYGTNGFYLEFKDSSALGDDTSGNTNDFTVNNLTSIDQTTDTPTNNFATMNPLTKSSLANLEEGNLKVIANSPADNGNTQITFAPQVGKWYFECKLTIDNASYPRIGIAPIESVGRLLNANDGQAGVITGSAAQYANGDKYISGSQTASYGASYSTGDIMGIALDFDNGAFYTSKNGTWQGSSDPESGASKTNALFTWTAGAEEYIASLTTFNTSSAIEVNFGNPAFTISSGNSDANGYGNFEYAVPSGYYALNTKNLAEYG